MAKPEVEAWQIRATPEHVQATKVAPSEAITNENDWSYALAQAALGRPIKRIYEEVLPALSYSQFTRRLNAKNPPAPEIPLSQHHEPGEKAQVDYCDGIPIYDAKTGDVTKTQFFCGVLPASSYIFGEFRLSQKSLDFMRSHERMWSYFGGVSKYVVIDNLRAGVSKPHRYDPDINPQYCDFANHCGFAVLPARVRTPRDKACVEASIGVIQRDFFDRCLRKKFYSLAVRTFHSCG